MPTVKDVPAGDDNAAAEVPVIGANDQPVATPEAATTGGAKLIRVRHGDVFHIDDKTTVDGTWREFGATAAKKIIEAADANGVRLAVADKKG
jgi:hypothetical protein